jgi:thiol-disulfide isomerase/thioredoxin
LLLSLSAASVFALFGAVTMVVPQPEISIAQTRVAGAMAKPLARELQGKPVLVDIYAIWCPGCKNIAPTLSTLKQKYQGRVNFVVFDVTDRSTTQASEAKAQKLGLSEFLAANKSQTSMVAIIDPSSGRVLKQFRNNPNRGDYVAVLDGAIAQMKK